MIDTMADKKRKRRSFLKRRLPIAGAALVIVLALGFFVVLPELVRRGQLNATIENALSSALGANVRIGGAEMTPTSEVVIHELRATHPGESSPFLTAERFTIGGDIASISSGNFAYLEASGLWIRLTVKDGRLDWKLPRASKQADIPAFTLLNGRAEIDVEGALTKIDVPKMIIKHIGGNLRTQVDGEIFLDGSASPITLSAGFLMDDVPDSLSLDVSAEDVPLHSFSGLAKMLGNDRLDIRDGTFRLAAKCERGTGYAEIALAGAAVSGLGNTEAVVNFDASLGVEYDAQRKTATISPRAENYLDAHELGRLDITAGSFVSFAGSKPAVDLRCSATKADMGNILGALFAPGDPRLKGAAMTGNFSAQNIRIFGTLPDLSAEVDCELRDASLSGFGAAFSGINGPLHISGGLSGQLTARGELRATHAAYSLDENAASLDNIAISGTVSADTASWALKADAVLTLSDGGRIACGGSVGLKDGSLDNVKLESDGDIESQQVWSLIQKLFLPQMAEWRLNGKARATALINSFTGADGVTRYAITWDADLHGCDASAPLLAKPITGLTGRAGAEIRTGSSFEEARNITLDLNSAEFERISVSQGLYSAVGNGTCDIKCTVKARNNEAALGVLLAKPPSGEFARELLKWDATAEMALAGTGSEFTLSLNTLTLTNGPGHAPREHRQVVLRDISARFQRAGEVLRMTASIPQLDLQTIWADTRHMFPKSYRDAKIAGVLNIAGEVAFAKDGGWSGEFTASAQGKNGAPAFRYSSPGENEQMDLGDADIRVHLAKQAHGDISADASISLGGFRYFHNGESEFTFDISDKPIAVKGSVDLVDDGKILLFRNTTLRVESLGEILMGGSARLDEDAAVSIFAQISSLDCATLFTKLLQENFSGQYEFLENLNVSGTLASNGVFLLGPPDALRLKGRIGLTGVNVSYKDFIAENVSADIPVDLSLGAPGTADAAAREGIITFTRFAAGPARVRNTRLPFHAVGNDIIFDEPFTFEVPGGTLSTQKFSISGVTLAKIRNRETEFRLSDIRGNLDLAQLTKTLGWTSMDGTADVRLTNLSVVGEDMSSEGTITMNAFGGNIEFSDMSTAKMFHGPAKIVFSAKINDVSLRAISHTFGFGEISGTLRGNIRGLKCVAGAPDEFDIDFDVVAGEGRYVKPEFLRDFAFVNSGRITDLPQNVLVGIGTARQYSYKEFGLHAKLKNYVLTLESKYNVKGQEAYMTAPWYGGVNILNENAGKNYKWKPIFERISNVLTGKGKVKINE